MPFVLFVCTANRFRSPLAAAFFRGALKNSAGEDAWRVDSAGTWAAPGLPPLAEVSLIARKYGLDLTWHRSKPVTEALLSASDLILVMESGHREALQAEFPSVDGRIFLLSQAAEDRTYDIPDLTDSVDAMFEIAANLSDLIQMGSENICRLAGDLRRSSFRAAT